MCILGDHKGGVRDPRDAWQHDPRWATRYENNYKTLNLITSALGSNMYDRVAHLEIAHDV
jgi:hypothetical protein